MIEDFVKKDLNNLPELGGITVYYPAIDSDFQNGLAMEAVGLLGVICQNAPNTSRRGYGWNLRPCSRRWLWESIEEQLPIQRLFHII